MALFQLENKKVEKIKPTSFRKEKELQTLIENNLETIFNCRFIDTEFTTGSIHSGRIDTLALSEENNPVIIEYKKVASPDLINQSLYYLHWITDHRGDFQVAVNKALGNNITVDWSDIRVICIAQKYKKYDLHAVQVMGTNIELWEYKIYENGILNLEEVFRQTEHIVPDDMTNGKNPIMVAAGKKAAITRKTRSYTVEQHTKILNKNLVDLFNEIRDYIINLDSSVEESPRQEYIAYKTSQNFVCLESHKNKIYLFLKINPDDYKPLPKQARDVRKIGHFGTGDFEFTITSASDFEDAKQLIQDSLIYIGG